MKGKKLLILLAGSLLTLSGCVKINSNPKKVNLLYGDIRQTEIGNITDLDELEYDELSSLVEHKENFILATFNPTCGCWIDYQKPLTYFINKHHYDIKYIDINKIIGMDNKFGIYSVAGDLPGIVFFKGGKILRQAKYYGNPKPSIFKKNKDFEKFVLENVNLPKLYRVEETVLDSYLNENKSFNLYVTKANCPDCGALDEQFLKPWNDEVNTVNNPLYIYDIAPHIGQSDYQATKNKYGLSYEGNQTFGWGTGAMPTLQYRQGYNIIDMITPLNDELEENRIVSYFTTEHVNASAALRSRASEFVLNGKEITKTFETSDEWRQEQVELQKEIINTFIDYYVK